MAAQLGISKTREGFKTVNDPTKYLKQSFLYFLKMGGKNQLCWVGYVHFRKSAEFHIYVWWKKDLHYHRILNVLQCL